MDSKDPNESATNTSNDSKFEAEYEDLFLSGRLSSVVVKQRFLRKSGFETKE